MNPYDEVHWAFLSGGGPGAVSPQPRPRSRTPDPPKTPPVFRRRDSARFLNGAEQGETAQAREPELLLDLGYGDDQAPNTTGATTTAKAEKEAQAKAKQCSSHHEAASSHELLHPISKSRLPDEEDDEAALSRDRAVLLNAPAISGAAKKRARTRDLRGCEEAQTTGRRHPQAVEVFATTFNVGNRRVNDAEMCKWLQSVKTADVVAVGLQEANYLSASQKRGLTVLAGSIAIGAAGFPPVAALGATAVGAMAVHSHVMPRLRRAVHRKTATKNNGGASQSHAAARDDTDSIRGKDGLSDDDADDDEDDDDDDARGGPESSSASHHHAGHHNRGTQHHEQQQQQQQQETTTKAPFFSGKGAEGTPMLSLAIASAVDRQLLPRGFARCAFVEYGQMRLIVYHNKASVQIDEVTHAKQGIGNFFNKGGLAARVKGRRLTQQHGKLETVQSPSCFFDVSFISAHLPAHAGQREARNAAMADIAQTLKPTLRGTDCTFLMGDLNYRLSLPPENWRGPGFLDDEKEILKRDVQRVDRFVKAGQLDVLYAFDELRDELVGRYPFEEFRGYATPAPTFPPTFKLKRKGPKHCGEYDDKRVPAWCDRVLFKCDGDSVRCLDVLAYDSCRDVTTSDHKPVYLRAHVFLYARKTPSLFKAEDPLVRGQQHHAGSSSIAASVSASSSSTSNTENGDRQRPPSSAAVASNGCFAPGASSGSGSSSAPPKPPQTVIHPHVVTTTVAPWHDRQHQARTATPRQSKPPPKKSPPRSRSSPPAPPESSPQTPLLIYYS